ncbi:MAG: hypothetical protein K2X43_07650 [Hyphomonadaceae bacterium]|nr:hypothetical protein [Hyphomonadaceae bacterium]
MTRPIAAAAGISLALGAGLSALALLPGPALAQDLCGRPSEPPQGLFDRLTKTEKLKEDFRDKSYVAISDKAKDTVWTFTMPGHPAHPSVVCRRPVQDGADLRLQMNVQCNAVEAECQRLVKAFQELNQRMMRDLRKQQGK